MTSDRKLKLTEIIEKNPGLNFRGLMRLTGLKNGVLSHHLNDLEKNGSVNAIRGPRQSRYYPKHISAKEAVVIKALRRETPKQIIQSLILNENLEFKEIVNYAKKSRSTVSLYLSQLVEAEILKVRLDNRLKKFSLKEKETVDRLIEDYVPGVLDKPISGFEDTFNSL